MGYKVYYLSDPRIGKPRYYGVTKSELSKRLQNHLLNIEYGAKRPKIDWINELKKDGLKPDITLIIEYEDRTTALNLETSLISNGKDLLNLVAGNGYRNLEYNDLYLNNLELSKKRRATRELKYGKYSRSKEKPQKLKRKRILTAQERERAINNLRPYWFKKKNS